MFEFIETKRHTVESVYGRPEAEILAKIDAKFEAVEFRIPAAADWCLSILNPTVYQSWGYTDEPRLILRRKTVKRRVLTETGEVRGAKTGELYAHVEGSILRAHWNHIVHSAIYAETFEEVEA